MENNPEEKLKDDMVRQVQVMAALFAAYCKCLQLDAYECTLEFMFADGEGRIRLTDDLYKTDPKDGKLKKLPRESSDPNASSLDSAEHRRRKPRTEVHAEEEQERLPTPEETVAALMKKLRLK